MTPPKRRARKQQVAARIALHELEERLCRGFGRAT